MARDADDGHQTDGQVSETRRYAGDTKNARRLAHNPEVAGSNPARYEFTHVRALSRQGEGLLRVGRCSEARSCIRAPRGPAARRRERIIIGLRARVLALFRLRQEGQDAAMISPHGRPQAPGG